MILDEIVASTRVRVATEKENITMNEYRRLAEMSMKLETEQRSLELQHSKTGVQQLGYDATRAPGSMEAALRKEGIHLICEVKKASPSKGIIAEEFDYLSIAKEYEGAGAAAISVLTEPDFFKGELRYLEEIKKEVHLPLLRKDFIIDEYQIYQSKVRGASCILLIGAILSKEQMKEYIQLCDTLGLSALVEIHDEVEAEMALSAGARIVGVNNRNLRDFTVDIKNSLKLRSYIPSDVVFVAESGIQSSSDVRKLYDANVNAVLIGETMMRSKNKSGMVQELLKEIPKRGKP